MTLRMALLRRLDADVAGTNVPAPVTPVRPLSPGPAPCQKLSLRMQCAWSIEEFHKVEKSGCRLEASQLDEADDIKRLAALIAVTAVRLLMLRDLAHRATDPAAPEQAAEMLQRAVPRLWIVVVAGADKKNPADPATLTPREFWLRIARQGGYIGRRSDGRPGWSTIWKGWYDFMFMFQGAELMAHAPMPKKCG